MAQIQFVYTTGFPQKIFSNPQIVGSWSAAGRYSAQWTSRAMAEAVGDDGCPRFTINIELDDAEIGHRFGWGVMLDGPAGPNAWAITTELPGATDRKREFILQHGQQTQVYYLSRGRALGANKLLRPGNVVAARFAVWAPNAQAVSLVWGNTVSGYVADDGTGQDAAKPAIVLQKTMANGADWNGVWETDSAEAALQDFYALVAQPYMYRLQQEGEAGALMRTDIYSRCQLGTGDARPPKDAVPALWRDLDGIVACSVVCDPDAVTASVADLAFPPANTIGSADFWVGEFDAHNPVPTRLRDMSVYILHVGGLGFGGPPGSPGTLKDAINHLDHVVNLGMNTICLMPISQYEGRASWGYGTSHFFAPDFAAGGRDLLKHFIKACHKKGIAVMLDVVYNHFASDTDRAEWEYDSSAPRLSAENVRSMFISSAIDFAVEFHIDGFRLDLTSALHASSTLNMRRAPSAGAANLAGQKFLREFNMTLDLIKPGLVIVAEDHSKWPAVTQPTRSGGLGFDAIWYVDFYHHLIGDSGKGPDYANLLRITAETDLAPLAIDYFAGALVASASVSIVYHESHDEAGNADWTLNGVKGHTARTIAAAVNRAPLFGATRWWAEARCRYAAGMTFLAPGTPMFFMGEEVGFQNDYTYDGFLGQREDFTGFRIGTGAGLFRFYQDIIRFRKRRPVVRGAGIEVLHIHNANRVLAFRRFGEGPDVIVAMSLSVQPFSNGYVVPLPHATATVWREVFNSDSRFYGGNDVGNGSSTISRNGDTLNIVLPAAGFVILEAQV